MLRQVVDWLRIRPSGIYVDATAGTGGHLLEIASRLESGRVIGIDRDPNALETVRARLQERPELKERVILVNANFSQIGEVVADAVQSHLGIGTVDGVLADLGISTLELDTPERGFSFRWAGPLDMRMNPAQELTAAWIVNHWPEKELADLLYQKAEERDSRRIAKAIVRARPIRDTGHLATVVAGACNARGRQRLHPATKTFLALRIAVNRESEELEQFLSRTPATISPEGRWVMLSYHSLEDRQVKHAFQQLGRTGDFHILTKKVIAPDVGEVAENPRARSAKLRVAERAKAAHS